MLASLDAGYSKVIEYFNKAERHPTYIAAVVLNPCLKWTVFRAWSPTDRLEARGNYRSSTGPVESPTALSATDNSFLGWLEETAGLEENARGKMERNLANESLAEIGKISARE